MSYMINDCNALIEGKGPDCIILTLLNDYNVKWFYQLIKISDYFNILNTIHFINNSNVYKHTFDYYCMQDKINYGKWDNYVLPDIRKLFLMIGHIANESFMTDVDTSKSKSLPYKQRNLMPLLISYISYCQSMYQTWEKENNTSLDFLFCFLFCLLFVCCSKMGCFGVCGLFAFCFFFVCFLFAVCFVFCFTVNCCVWFVCFLFAFCLLFVLLFVLFFLEKIMDSCDARAFLLGKFSLARKINTLITVFMNDMCPWLIDFKAWEFCGPYLNNVNIQFRFENTSQNKQKKKIFSFVLKTHHKTNIEILVGDITH